MHQRVDGHDQPLVAATLEQEHRLPVVGGRERRADATDRAPEPLHRHFERLAADALAHGARRKVVADVPSFATAAVISTWSAGTSHS